MESLPLDPRFRSRGALAQIVLPPLVAVIKLADFMHNDALVNPTNQWATFRPAIFSGEPFQRRSGL